MKLKKLLVLGMSAAMISSTVPGTVYAAEAGQDNYEIEEADFQDETAENDEQAYESQMEDETGREPDEKTQTEQNVPDETVNLEPQEAAPAEEIQEQSSDVEAFSDEEDFSDDDDPDEESNIEWKISDDGVLTISGEGEMPDYMAYQEGYEAPWSSVKDKIKQVVIESGITKIGNDAFFKCKNLTEVKLPDTITEIGSAVFYDCTNLKTINIPESATVLGDSLFYECNSLESIELPAGLEIIPQFFLYDCEKLTSIKIPDKVKEIGANAFSGCSGLETVNIPEGVTLINSQVFYGCKNLQTIEIPNTVTNIEEAAFYNCSKLQDLIISGSVERIGSGAFAGCRSLASVKIEKGVKTIESDAFQRCYSLNGIELPDGTETIGDNAFGYGSYMIFGVTIPTSVTSLGKPSTHVIRFTGSEEQWNKINKNGYDADYAKMQIYFNYKADPAHEHSYIGYIVKESDCIKETEGERVWRCGLCGELLSTETIPVEHKWEKTSETAATCTTAGSVSYRCEKCRKTKEETTPAAGHKYSAWKTSKTATVFTAKTLTHKCTVCGKTETQTSGSKLKPSIKISVSSLTLKTRQKTTVFKVTGLAKGDSIVSWKSSDTKIAAISGKSNGTSTITAGTRTGKAKITVKLKSGLSKTITVTVQKTTVKTTKISGISTKMTLRRNQKVKLSPVLTPVTSQEKVTYKSSNTKIATVSSTGQITAKKKGTAVITVKSGKKTVSCKVTVK